MRLVQEVIDPLADVIAGTVQRAVKLSVARSGGTQPKAMPAEEVVEQVQDSALDYVKKSIEAKYGKGAIMDTSKKKNEEVVTEKKKGLWDNIHAKRKRGEKNEIFFW